jgi:hypothetical protein
LIYGRQDEKGTGEPGSLGTVQSYEEANAVYVESDFSDPEGLIEFLQHNEDVAWRIARNQRETVVERGYLGLVVEMCYWRSLIRA